MVQGLGVKLLEKVYSIMEEDDEVKREVNALHIISLGLLEINFDHSFSKKCLYTH